jgi:hypothetical protein
MPFSLDESYVVATERALGARLPESYRQAMLRSNGGEIEAFEDNWQLHPIEDTSESKRLSRTANHVLKETKVCQGWQGFPREAVAIAANGGGDTLVFMRSNGTFEPSVYVWSHEVRNLSKVANDFSELTAS